MSRIHAILDSLAERLFPKWHARRKRELFWQNGTRDIIIRYGADAPRDSLRRARELGFNVEALIAEHDRLKSVSWSLDFSINLEPLQHLHADDLTASLKNLSVIPEKTLETKGKDLSVSLGGPYKRISLANKLLTLTEVMSLGIEAIANHVLSNQDQFPKNRYPLGLGDYQLTSFSWDESSQQWYLYGTRKDEALQRLPKILHPDRSIDSHRCPSQKKPLISSEEFPVIEELWLNIWDWPSGNKEVMRVELSEDLCSPPSARSHPDQPQTLRVKHPDDAPPNLKWDHNIFDWHNAATHNLARIGLRQAQLPADHLLPHTTEAVFIYYLANPVSDLADPLVSLVSGPTGPAPVPLNTPWPCCSNCEEPLSFSQTVDLRDLNFTHLLPGSTISIFVCTSCHQSGEWQNCSTVIWLNKGSSVNLITNGDAHSIKLGSQWYDGDLPASYDLPTSVEEDLEKRANKISSPCLALPSSYGTKAGGFPRYLQYYEPFFDRDGIVMEYIGQIGTPDYIDIGGFGYVYHSTSTGETYIDFQDT